MFFFLAKILGFLATPSNALLLLAFAGVVLGLREKWRRVGYRLTGTAVVLTVIAAYSPLATMLMRGLEDRIPRAVLSEPAGFVILGGMVNPDLSALRDEVSLNESAERITVVAELARRYPKARIIFSGGDASLRGKGGVEAEVARRLLVAFGIDPARVELEGRARDTYENAVFSRLIAQPKPGEQWVMITSAFHMPRAMGVFRTAGFAVAPYAVDYRTAPDGKGQGWSLGAAAGGLKQLDVVAHEIFGLVAYRLSGRTDALFPAP